MASGNNPRWRPGGRGVWAGVRRLPTPQWTSGGQEKAITKCYTFMNSPGPPGPLSTMETVNFLCYFPDCEEPWRLQGAGGVRIPGSSRCSKRRGSNPRFELVFKASGFESQVRTGVRIVGVQIQGSKRRGSNRCSKLRGFESRLRTVIQSVRSIDYPHQCARRIYLILYYPFVFIIASLFHYLKRKRRKYELERRTLGLKWSVVHQAPRGLEYTRVKSEIKKKCVNSPC